MLGVGGGGGGILIKLKKTKRQNLWQHVKHASHTPIQSTKKESLIALDSQHIHLEFCIFGIPLWEKDCESAKHNCWQSTTYSRISCGFLFSMGHLKKQQGPSTMSANPSFPRLSLRRCHIPMIHSVARSNGSSGCGSFPSPKWYRRRRKCRANRLRRGSTSWRNCTHRKCCCTRNSMPVDLQARQKIQNTSKIND